MLEYNRLEDAQSSTSLSLSFKFYFYGSICFLFTSVAIGIIYSQFYQSQHCVSILSSTIVVQSISTSIGLYKNWLKQHNNDKWEVIYRYHKYIDLLIIGISTTIYYHESGCRQVDPIPYYTLISLLVYNYIYVVLLLVAFCLLLFFTPCYIFLIRPFINRKNRLTEEEIGNLSHTICVTEQEACAICLNKIVLGSEIIKLPCGHYYHSKCISQWLQIKHTCPICRISARQAVV